MNEEERQRIGIEWVLDNPLMAVELATCLLNPKNAQNKLLKTIGELSYEETQKLQRFIAAMKEGKT